VKRLLKRGVPVAEVPARLKTIKKRKKRSVNDQKRKPKSPKPFPEAVSEAFIDSEQQEHQSELDTFVHQDSPDCYHIESEAVLNAMPSQSYRTLTVSPGVVLSARVVSRILDVLKPDGQLKILSLHKGGK
jgi:hypothetical protein